MKPNLLLRAYVPVSSIGLVLLCVTTAFAQPQNAAREEHERKRQLSALTMPEAAKRAGQHYVRDWNVGAWAIAGDIKSLADSSQVVVVGDVVNQRAVLSKDQMYISTVATVRVVETVKGGATGSLKLVVVGGRMTFPDGTSAETKASDGEPLKTGGRYVLFLDPLDRRTPRDLQADEAIGGYAPKLGPQGVFELQADGVKSQGRDIDNVKRLHERESTTAFLDKVRKAVGSKKPAL